MKVIRETYLKADSKNNAWYKLVTEEISGGFIIRKESGTEGRALHKEIYFRESIVKAQQFHSKKIKEKTNTKSKRKRIYYVVSDSEMANNINQNCETFI